MWTVAAEPKSFFTFTYKYDFEFSLRLSFAISICLLARELLGRGLSVIFILNLTVVIKTLTKVESASVFKDGFLVLPVGEAHGASHVVNSMAD